MNIAEKTRSSEHDSLKRSWGLRGFCHALIAACAWVLFFFWWRQVLGFTRSQDVIFVLIFIGVTVVITTLLNLIWVRHNVGIFRRKGPRTRVTEVAQDRASDSLGRPIQLPAAGSIRRSRVVTVSASEKVKTMDAGEAS